MDDELSSRIRELENKGRLAEAAAMLEQHLEENSDDVVALTTLARLHMAIWREKSTVRHQQLAVRALRRLALIYDGREDWENAFIAYQRILDISPEDQRAQKRLVALGREIDAVTPRRPPRDVQRAERKKIAAQLGMLSGRPDDIGLLLHIAEAYQRVGDDGPAASAFMRVAELCEDRGELPRALDAWKKVLGVVPGHALARERIEAIQHALSSSRAPDDPLRELGKRALEEARALFSEGHPALARERALLARVLMPRSLEVEALLEHITREI